jgi:hypothetical protein
MESVPRLPTSRSRVPDSALGVAKPHAPTVTRVTSIDDRIPDPPLQSCKIGDSRKDCIAANSLQYAGLIDPLGDVVRRFPEPGNRSLY